jgi:hypothetical protein
LEVVHAEDGAEALEEVAIGDGGELFGAGGGEDAEFIPCGAAADAEEGGGGEDEDFVAGDGFFESEGFEDFVDGVAELGLAEGGGDLGGVAIGEEVVAGGVDLEFDFALGGEVVEDLGEFDVGEFEGFDGGVEGALEFDFGGGIGGAEGGRGEEEAGGEAEGCQDWT